MDGPAGRQTAEEVPAPAGGCPADAPAVEEERKSPRSAQRGEGAVVGWTATDTRMHRNTADGGGGGRAVCEEKPRFWCAGRRGKRTGGKGREFALCRLGGVYSPLWPAGGESGPKGVVCLPFSPPRLAQLGLPGLCGQSGWRGTRDRSKRAEGLKGKNVWPTRMLRQLKRGELGAKSRGVGIGGWFGLLGLRGSWSGERREQKRRP